MNDIVYPVLLRCSAIMGYKPRLSMKERREEILNMCKYILKRLGVDCSEIENLFGFFEG